MLRRLKLALCALLLALFALAAPGMTAYAQEDGAALREAERSVVRIVVLHLGADDQPVAVMAGSGFVVAPGKIVTNNHVVEAPVGAVRTLYFVVPDKYAGNERKPATLSQTWPDADLAMLDAPELAAPALKIAANPPSKEALVRALGYPGVTDRMRKLPLEQSLKPSEPYVTSGSIALFSDTAPGGGAFDTIFHTAPIDHGNSGGPLLDECARVIGVNTWSASESMGDDGTVESHPGQFAAIRSSVVSRFLERAGVTVTPDAAPCVRTVPVDPALQAQVEKANAAASAAEAAAKKAVQERDSVVRWGFGVLVLLALGALVWFLLSRRRAMDATLAAEGAPRPAANPTLPLLLGVGVAVVALGLAGWWMLGHRHGRSGTAKVSASAVALNCRFVPAKSFNPLPQAGALSFSFDPEADCVNGKTPYEKVQGGFSRVTLGESGRGASQLYLSPDMKTFVRKDFALSAADYAAFAAARKSVGAVRCPAPGDTAAAQAAAGALAKVRNLSTPYLGAEPSRIMTWSCEPK
ncbi:MAG: trypsin-like peptidase domain-containing protein [Proteobacteria bacterium]|nr:trypsin-like peptidase domain-containing protein [Pseudomonadota bacterium]